MAESKRTFQAAKMNKDIDDRLLQPGTYRDALNVSVEFSEDGNVGALENLKGNELIVGQNITGLSAASNPNAKVIGSVAHPEESKIYYFVTGDTSDGIFEYDVVADAVSTIIIDSSTPPPTPVELEFAFSDALATASVAVNGAITVSCSRGEITSLTEDFDETVSTDTVRDISVRVLVPQEYSNAGDYVYGDLTATQTAIAAPPADSIIILEPTNLEKTTVTLNAKYTQDAAGITDIGFYYIKNTGGSETISSYSNKFVITKLVGNGANISSGSPNWSDPFDGVASSDVTVIDGDGNTVASSNWTYEQYAGAQPSTIQFNSGYSAVLPITVAQTSTLTTVTDALSKASIYGSGTQVSLSSNITSPFKTDVTGLDSNSEYAALAYVTNASGTTYSDVLNFKTKDVSYSVFPSGEFIWTTNVGVAGSTPDSVDARNIGYGPFNKNNKTYIFAAYPNSPSLGSTGVTVTHPQAYNEFDSIISLAQNFATVASAPSYMKQVDTPTATGRYLFTATKSGYTTSTYQYAVGSIAYKTTLTVNTTNIHVASANIESYQYNFSPNTLVHQLGPTINDAYAYVIIPLNNTATAFTTDTDQAFKSSFNPENLTVTITGHTEGDTWKHYIETASSAIFGRVPGIIIKAKPSVLGTTATLNITYTT
jgi:hypothetical protein